jgi:hypothetical protein
MLEVDQSIKSLFNTILSIESDMSADLRDYMIKGSNIEILRVLPNCDLNRIIRGVKTVKGVIKDTKSTDYFNIVGTETV